MLGNLQEASLCLRGKAGHNKQQFLHAGCFEFPSLDLLYGLGLMRSTLRSNSDSLRVHRHAVIHKCMTVRNERDGDAVKNTVERKRGMQEGRDK